jgi:hypothetical protein
VCSKTASRLSGTEKILQLLQDAADRISTQPNLADDGSHYPKTVIEQSEPKEAKYEEEAPARPEPVDQPTTASATDTATSQTQTTRDGNVEDAQQALFQAVQNGDMEACATGSR